MSKPLTFSRGTSIVIEAEFKQYTPFFGLSYVDPDSNTYKITVKDENENIVVNGSVMTRSDQGKYYYIIQTKKEWDPGVYSVEVSSSIGNYSSVSVDESNFILS